MNERKSEIADLIQQFDAERDAAYRALYFPNKGTAQHQFITARMERMGELHEQMTEIVGEQQAAAMVVEMMNAQ